MSNPPVPFALSALLLPLGLRGNAAFLVVYCGIFPALYTYSILAQLAGPIVPTVHFKKRWVAITPAVAGAACVVGYWSVAEAVKAFPLPYGPFAACV